MRILAVDDSAVVRQMLDRLLKELGYENVVLADSAKAAMAELEEAAFDLILLDWHMPGIDGFQFLKWLKGRDATAAIPVIMLTSESNSENVIKAVKSGLDGYILKPINKDLLADRLKAASQGRHQGFHQPLSPS